MKKILFSFAFIWFAVTGMVHAQTLNEAIDLFNDAAEKTNKGDYQIPFVAN